VGVLFDHGLAGLAVAEGALCAEHHFIFASYRLFTDMNCDLCHML